MPRITALSTDIVRALQAGGPDANGQKPERSVSSGTGNPCRHCLREIPDGFEMLILAHRPFPNLQPYAETGPIFLCAQPCSRYEGTKIPDILATSPDYLMKGYDQQDRIIYGTGAIIPSAQMMEQAARLLSDEKVAYVHIRSARNNCYQARIDREPAKPGTHR